jgi:hypothetical protein
MKRISKTFDEESASRVLLDSLSSLSSQERIKVTSINSIKEQKCFMINRDLDSLKKKSSLGRKFTLVSPQERLCVGKIEKKKTRK